MTMECAVELDVCIPGPFCLFRSFMGFDAVRLEKASVRFVGLRLGL